MAHGKKRRKASSSSSGPSSAPETRSKKQSTPCSLQKLILNWKTIMIPFQSSLILIVPIKSTTYLCTTQNLIKTIRPPIILGFSSWFKIVPAIYKLSDIHPLKFTTKSVTNKNIIVNSSDIAPSGSFKKLF